MKAQGLPITVIIVAALGLLVLIVISAIFSGQIGKFGKASTACPGTCIAKADKAPVCDPETQKTLFGKYKDPSDPTGAKECAYCCVTIG